MPTKNTKISLEWDTKTNEKLELKRVLGLPHGVAIICGLIIGSGIYVVPQGIMSRVQAPGLMLLLWAGAALFSLLGALSFAELGTTFPVFGEKYAYLSIMVGPYVGFQSLWSYLIFHRPGANAIKCLTFARYILQPVFPYCGIPGDAILLIAAAMSCILTFINCLNIKWAARSQGVLTITSVSTLITIGITGFVWVGKGNTNFLGDMFDGVSSDVGNIAVAASTAIFSISGWQALNFMVEELKDPYKTLPRAICVSIFIVGILYFFVNFAYVAVLGPEKIIETSAVAVSMAQVAFGPATWVMSILIAVCNAGSFNSGTLITSRLFYSGARNKHLPNVFCHLNLRTTSPIAAMVFQGLLTTSLCFFDVFTILNNIVFTSNFFEGLCITGMVYHRWKKPDLPRPLKIPIIIPILFMIITWSLILIIAITKPQESAVGFVISVTSGTLFYLYMVVWKPEMKFTIGLTTLIQKILICAPQDVDKDEVAADKVAADKIIADKEL